YGADAVSAPCGPSGPTEVQMRKGLVVGVGAALAVATLSSTDASACGRRDTYCGGYAPPAAYQYAPPPGYGYVPPAPVSGYGYGSAPPAYYAPPSYGFYGDAAYGGYRGCDRGYGYTYSSAPSAGYYGYRPAAVWVPVR